MTLYDAKPNNTYLVTQILTQDNDLKSFLFTLGLMEGEKVFVLTLAKSNMTIKIKNSRYNIDKNLSKIISVELI